MFTMRLDLSLCGMWYCEALVLLVGVLLCGVLTLPRAYCVICTVYAAACSIRVVVYSALLYVATACLLRPCWEKVISSPKLGWVVVILSVGRGIVRAGWLDYFYGFWSFSRASKILLGAMLELSFKWMLLDNSL